jgi:hypothetical protein
MYVYSYTKSSVFNNVPTSNNLNEIMKNKHAIFSYNSHQKCRKTVLLGDALKNQYKTGYSRKCRQWPGE